MMFRDSLTVISSAKIEKVRPTVDHFRLRKGMFSTADTPSVTPDVVHVPASMNIGTSPKVDPGHVGSAAEASPPPHCDLPIIGTRHHGAS